MTKAFRTCAENKIVIYCQPVGEEVFAVAEKKGIKVMANNRKAFHDYFVEDKYEAGIELKGTEVKSVRAGTLNLKDSYVIAKNGEAYVHSMHISPYDKGNIFNHDPDRPKRLLLHKREIVKLAALAAQDGYALVPLSVYFKDAKVKVELGVCKGKKNYDKREAAAQRDAKRQIDRAMRERY
ncbi:MAG: SsrA-binding protein SmpB [Oscillospiraceae bacterium]|nr:SsrA-binding protein SmpB [Oscillospiraceae bacterium]